MLWKKKRSEEWIESKLAEIEKLRPQPVEESSGARYSISDDVKYSFSRPREEKFKEWAEEEKTPTFQERLREEIIKSGKSNVSFYRAAGIDRKRFSAIMKDKNYHPSKETAVACCIGLGLEKKEADELLKLAGYSLSLSIAWDRVIYYCLREGITDLSDINDLLYAMGEKCIGVIA